MLDEVVGAPVPVSQDTADVVGPARPLEGSFDHGLGVYLGSPGETLVADDRGQPRVREQPPAGGAATRRGWPGGGTP